MTFSHALDLCFKNFAIGKGRASRSEYWYFYLFTVLVGVALQLLLTVGNRSSLLTLVSIIVEVLLIVPGITVLVRRLHDTNRSAFHLFWAFIPIAGAIVLLVFLTTPGTIGPNNYGEARF